MKQDAPFSLHIEPTEGCTLACSFCGMQAIRDNGANAEAAVHGARSGPYKFMEVALAVRLAHEVQRLKWNPRIELDMRGEPTLNPNLNKIIKAFRNILPKSSITVTSNGSGVMKDYQMAALFDAGLNTLALDDYRHANFVGKIRPWISAWCKANNIKGYLYPRDNAGNPHQRFFGQRVVIIQDIVVNNKGTHQLTNQAGNSFNALEEPLVQRCAKPFREMSVHYGGNVPVCCDDWTGSYKIGNVMDTPLDELWHGERFDAARRLLYAGNRAALKPCSKCNVRTYRNGLLPDKMGKEVMPKATAQTLEVVKEAQRGKVFTIKPV